MEAKTSNTPTAKEVEEDNHFETVKGPCDSILEIDKHYMRIFKIHEKARSHSYANFIWMCFTAYMTFHFSKYLFFEESNV